MNWEARVIDDPMRDSVRLALFRHRGDGQVEVVTGIDPNTGLVSELHPEGTSRDPWTLPALPYHLALPLLDALARHFGGTGDTRQLRKDYDAERARVDRLIGAVIDRRGDAH